MKRIGFAFGGRYVSAHVRSQAFEIPPRSSVVVIWPSWFAAPFGTVPFTVCPPDVAVTETAGPDVRRSPSIQLTPVHSVAPAFGWVSPREHASLAGGRRTSTRLVPFTVT